MYDKEIKTLEYPKEHIKYINYIGIHKNKTLHMKNQLLYQIIKQYLFIEKINE